MNKDVFRLFKEQSSVIKYETKPYWNNTLRKLKKNQISPFREISPLDEKAKTWSSIFNVPSSGFTIFDFNSDGLLDIMIAHSGQNLEKATDSKGVLVQDKISIPNQVYINQGNDKDGNPIYKNLTDIIKKSNTKYLKEELLFEGLYFPRNSPSAPIDKIRLTSAIIPVDINSDGKTDLILGQGMPGSQWSHEKTIGILPPFGHPIGRNIRKNYFNVESPMNYFLKDYKAIDDLHTLVLTERGQEPMATNTILINLGDKDHDGIPEWKDVTKNSGFGGKRFTSGFAIADFDLDGDLDIYEINVMDLDLWPGATRKWAGAYNQFFVNQLSETGKLKFIESADKFKVKGEASKTDPLPEFYKLKNKLGISKYLPIFDFTHETFRPELLDLNDKVAEDGRITWATIVQDINDDGYPDIWVGNDFGQLKSYINQSGNSFQSHIPIRKGIYGNWMSLVADDFDQDGKEDLFSGNSGLGNTTRFFDVITREHLYEPTLMESMAIAAILLGNINKSHALLNGRDFTKELRHTIKPSPILPPNELPIKGINDYKSSIYAYEFVWGASSLDIQNDGLMDLYFLGNLYTRSGSVYSNMSSNPGRLLVNRGVENGRSSFEELSTEHQLLNISEVKYDKLWTEGFIYRKAPAQNWSKREIINSYDYTSASFSLLKGGINSIKVNDMLRVSENGRTCVAADLNNDGYEDLVLRNLGGYDSLKSNSKSLKAIVNGKVRALPQTGYSFPPPTNFEPGETKVFINTYKRNNWIKISLEDRSKKQFNRQGIMAKVIVNDSLLKINRLSSNALGSRFTPLNFGLRQDSLKKIKVIWPDKKRTSSEYFFKPSVKNTHIILYKNGMIRYQQ
jgi:hypothetical protein